MSYQFPGQQPQQYGPPQNQPQGFYQPPQAPAPVQGFDPYANLGATKPQQNSSYFLVGNYEVQIDSVDNTQSQKDGTVFFGVNAKILRSSIPEHRPAGMVCRQTIKITGNSMGLPNVKGFILAMMGITSSHPEYEQWCQAVTGAFLHSEIIAKQVLSGRVALLECTNKVTKGKGEDFTVHKWTLKV